MRTVAIYSALAIGGAAMAFPFLWMLASSLKSSLELTRIPLVWWPHHPEWSNFGQVFSVIPMARMFMNSLIVTSSVTLGILFTSALAGYSLAKYEFRGRQFVFFFTLSTMFIPYFILMVPLYYLMMRLGWLDTYASLIVPNLVTGFGIFLMRQFMMGIPNEILDAARIDGAREWRIFAQIALPAAAPALAALGIFAFVYQWDNFLWPLLVVSKPAMYTVPLGLSQLAGYENAQQNMNLVMAAAALAVLPVTAVFIALQRHFVRGITLSGIKG